MRIVVFCFFNTFPISYPGHICKKNVKNERLRTEEITEEHGPISCERKMPYSFIADSTLQRSHFQQTLNLWLTPLFEER